MNGHSAPNNGTGLAYAKQEPADANHSGPSSSATSTPIINGYAQPSLYQVHNEEIVDHLFQSGFQAGNYSDIVLHVRQNAYRLHALILSRSPFLAHLMSTSPQTAGAIYVPLEHEPEVTEEGFAIALGYLYSSISLNHINPQNARAALAAGCLLGHMDDLCNYAYEVCRQSITLENITAWLEFVDATPASSNGTSTPIEPPSPLSPRTGVFGPYAQRLRDNVFHFLVVTLPQMLNVGGQATPVSPHPDGHAPSDAGRDTLLQVFARVPFDLFKTAVESPTFQIGSDQARFKFAKDAIELRKRGVARGQGAEETVVLAFGGGFGGSAVHVTRKLRKRPLWKVNS